MMETGNVCTGNTTITNLWFSNAYIDPLAEDEREPEIVVEISTKPAQEIKWR